MRALKKKTISRYLWILLVLVFGFSACENSPTQSLENTQTPVADTLTPSAEVPSPTPMPAAAIVNGERISLALFESEVSRYLFAQEEMGQPEADESAAREAVLNDLIDQVLLAQGARAAGISFSDEDVQTRIDSLAAETNLSEWMSNWGYSEKDLHQLLKLQMFAAAQRDNLADSIPDVVEHAKLQQIFAYTKAGAESALVSLSSGRDFNDIAFTYDPVAGGHLGWVPRGYLFVEAVEEAAFSMPVGSYSEIIESDVGYHIVMVLERGERELTSDARLTLERKTLYAWLEDQRASSTIEVLID